MTWCGIGYAANEFANVPGWSGTVLRYLSRIVLNLSTFCFVGAVIRFGLLRCRGSLLYIRGPRTKKDAFLMVCMRLGIDLLVLYFGFTVVPVLAF